MEKEHIPAKTTPGRTVFRFTQAEITEALLEWLAAREEDVPNGRVNVTPWVAVLTVVAPAPPPTRKDSTCDPSATP